jgi:hypothetical protein
MVLAVASLEIQAYRSDVGGGEGTAEELPPAGRVTDETTIHPEPRNFCAILDPAAFMRSNPEKPMISG